MMAITTNSSISVNCAVRGFHRAPGSLMAARNRVADTSWRSMLAWLITPPRKFPARAKR